MADTCVFLMEQNIGDGIYNVGTPARMSLLVRPWMWSGPRARWYSIQASRAARRASLLSVDFLHALGWRAKDGLHEGFLVCKVSASLTLLGGQSGKLGNH